MAANPRSRVSRVLVAAAAVALLGCAGPAEDAGPAGTGSASSPSGPAGDPGTLLAPVRLFVDAVAARDADRVVQAFTGDGVVIDVSRRIEGREALRRWAANETITGTLTVLRVVQNGTDRQRLLVRFAPRGTGGFSAHYTFTVAGGRIAQLDMQYA